MKETTQMYPLILEKIEQSVEDLGKFLEENGSSDQLKENEHVGKAQEALAAGKAFLVAIEASKPAAS